PQIPWNSGRVAGGHPKTGMKPPQYDVPPRKTARDGHFLDPPPPAHYPFPAPRYQTPRRQGARTAMFHGTRPGWIEVIAGVMFSGKSEELVRRGRGAVMARKPGQGSKSHLAARSAA